MSNSLSSTYLHILRENQELRKQLLTLDSSISFYQLENKKIQDRVQDLESKLEELLLRNSILSVPDCLVPLSPSDSKAYSRSSSLKKMFTKDFDSEVLYENTSETCSKEPNFFLSFHVVSLVQVKGKILSLLNGEILFSYPEDKTLEKSIRSKIIEFAFPNGVFFQEFSLNESLVNQVSEIIYQAHYRDGNSYVTILKVDEEQVYACFVLFYDIAVSEQGNQCIVPVCYCLLSMWPCFELHFGVLNRMLDLKRTTRCESSSTFMETGDMSMLLSEDIVTCEELSLLSKYYSYLNHSISCESLSIQISLDSVEPIEYELPLNLSSLDHQWFCPVFFSSISSKLFTKLYLTIIQEQRILICSKNLDVLTSAVFALNSLLEPFRWQFPLVPLLTDIIVHDVADSRAFIVGSPLDQFESCKLPFWVFDLDSQIVREEGKCDKVFVPGSVDLRSSVKKFFRVFDGETCFIPTEKQEKGTKDIIDEIKKFNVWVITSLQSLCISKNDIDYEIIKQLISRKSAAEDKDFFVKVYETEMFRLINKCFRVC